MTDAAAYDDLARRWLDGQQRAWQAWLGGDPSAHPAADHVAALAGGLDAGATLGHDVAARLLTQGQQFLKLAEALGELLAEQAGRDEPPDWQALFDTMIARATAALAPGDDGSAHPAGALAGLLDAWRDAAAACGLPAPDDATAAASAAGYAAALQAYAGALAEIQRDALERLRRELNDQHAAGGTITSLRALYDLWVDASEAAYLERAATPGFAALQAELAHALCRLHAAGPGATTRGTGDG